MENYIALLRGINISGKNKIPMAELKQVFEQQGFAEVRTLLNSGNVRFSCDETDAAQLTGRIAAMIQCRFGLEIPVFVLSQERLADILRHAPDWWGTGDRAIYDNLIFVLPPATCAEVRREIGEPKTGMERIAPYQEAIFWSFSRKDYQKTNWWPKTASAAIGQQLTIRTANTVRKLVEL